MQKLQTVFFHLAAFKSLLGFIPDTGYKEHWIQARVLIFETLTLLKILCGTVESPKNFNSSFFIFFKKRIISKILDFPTALWLK